MKSLIFPHSAPASLRAVRVGALALMALLVVSWMASAGLWARNTFTDLDPILEATFFDGWTAEEIRAAAIGSSLPLTMYPLIVLLSAALLLVGFGSMSLLLFIRKPDWFGTYLAVTLMIIGTALLGPILGQFELFGLRIQGVADNVLLAIAFVAFSSLPYLFPDGRFVPGWTVWLFLILALATLRYSAVLFCNQAACRGPEDGIVAFGVPVSLLLVGILSQVYRYVKVSGPIQRQQAKGLIFAFAFIVAIMSIGPFLAPNAMIQSQPPVTSDLVAGTFSFFAIVAGLLIFVVALTLALMRYRLWDIDLIVRKTTTYALVTGVLILGYFASIVILQRIFTAVTGQTSTVAIVLSTLLIAALFLPVRRRVQDLIDRRFFRSKYDAEKVLNEFAATVRDETDLDALTAELRRVIQETMQPEQVTVWLAQESGDANVTTFAMVEEDGFHS